MIKIYAVKTPDCYYISDNPLAAYSYNKSIGLGKYLFDGKNAEPSFHPSWLVIKEAPRVMTHTESQPDINHRYRLIDESLESDKFPLEMVREDVAVCLSDEYYWQWKPEYKHLESLYKLISDKQPALVIEDEFEFVVCLEVGEITAPTEIEYRAQRTQWSHEGTTVLDNKNITHQVIDLIMFPSLVIHETPCKLSSEDTFKIVRQYVKDNIDPRVATITSDYNFCFTVQKRVPLAKPYEYTYNKNWLTKRKPKYATAVRKDMTLPCFEMTWSPENYKGYTPIRGFEGRNEADLKEQIDTYLEHLMAVINEPMVECDKCCGVGYLRGEAPNEDL